MQLPLRISLRKTSISSGSDNSQVNLAREGSSNFGFGSAAALNVAEGVIVEAGFGAVKMRER